MKKESTIYFEGLNGLRFFAALAVIITHVELIKGVFKFKHYWNNPIIFNLGGLGVYFFFVLSGFLITYLLLSEKQKFNKIEIKQFYLRRIFRIWPLYYFIIIVGFFILPQYSCFHISYLQKDFESHFYGNLFLYLIILPNLAYSMFSAVPNIGQVWSIGIEEQFYILWPLIIAKSKNIIKTLVYIMIGLILLKIGILVLGFFVHDATWYISLKKFVAMSKFECMALGGIGAVMLFNKHVFLKYFLNKQLLSLSLILIPCLIFLTPPSIQDGIHLAYSFLFLVIIIHVSAGKVKLNLENDVLNYLGKISYGIYMYHFMVIPFVLWLCKRYLIVDSEVLMNIIIYTLTILLTIIVSGLSYKFFELPFIKMKSKYSPIKSGKLADH